MDLSTIKTGDQIFIHFTFDINDMETYISDITRFSMNYQSIVKHKQLIKNQHCGIAYWWNGELYLKEQISSGTRKTLFTERFKGKEESFFIKRYPGVEFDAEFIENFNAKYNWPGIASQYVRQLTFNVVDFEANKTGIKHLYCSQYNAYIVFIASKGKFCQFWPSTDTQDLQLDFASEIIPFIYIRNDV